MTPAVPRHPDRDRAPWPESLSTVVQGIRLPGARPWAKPSLRLATWVSGPPGLTGPRLEPWSQSPGLGPRPEGRTVRPRRRLEHGRLERPGGPREAKGEGGAPGTVRPRRVPRTWAKPSAKRSF